jgi:hypothetical protein
MTNNRFTISISQSMSLQNDDVISDMPLICIYLVCLIISWYVLCNAPPCSTTMHTGGWLHLCRPTGLLNRVHQFWLASWSKISFWRSCMPTLRFWSTDVGGGTMYPSISPDVINLVYLLILRHSRQSKAHVKLQWKFKIISQILLYW